MDLLLRRRAGLGAGVGFRIGKGDGAGVGTEGVDIGKSIGFSFGNGVLMTDSSCRGSLVGGAWLCSLFICTLSL